MSNNVFILGAGFSYDAGIPLLSNFIERMWEYGNRGRKGKEKLSSDQIKALLNASEIIDDLASYHRRVRFDDDNIEDVMSMLAFDVMAGGKGARNKLSRFVKAIAETIEIACVVKHPGANKLDFTWNHSGKPIYQQFWHDLFYARQRNIEFPTIISLNYDLVLERSLFQSLQFPNASQKDDFHLDSLTVDFQYPGLEELHYQRYHQNSTDTVSLNCISKEQINTADSRHLNIEILKLHGSLNFPSGPIREIPHNIALSVANPHIVPPTSNKQASKKMSGIWSRALKRIREAKTITFVGYSLPDTDTYMQYFLKAAAGPNKDLRSISVFDPMLLKQNDLSKQIENRYTSCFSDQMRKKIKLRPAALPSMSERKRCTTEHFIRSLETNEGSIMYQH